MSERAKRQNLAVNTTSKGKAAPEASSGRCNTRALRESGNALANRKSESPSGGMSLSARVRQVNRWRDNFNPVRGLTMSRAAGLVEAAMRGEWADFQWAFMAPVAGIECADPDLLALIECRTSALSEMDYNVKACEHAAGEKALAREQVAAAREMLDGIGNLYAAMDHLAMASFRGFAHCEQIRGADGDLVELRPVPQWRMLRRGGEGPWKYNAGDLSAGWLALDDSWLIEPETWLIREVPRFIHRIALTKFIRANLSQKDWDSFIEIYGIPGGIVIGPPNVPPEKSGEYAAAAEGAATSGHAYLPNGSTYTPNDSPRGTNPFSDHMRYLSEQLVLAGTGGKLTMLTESGSGTLAGGAHQETFERIARGEARRISEILQKQVVAPFLSLAFPGRPEIAYFELAFREEVETGKIVEDAVKLAQAGYQIDAAELAEKTGYKITLKAVENAEMLKAEGGKVGSDETPPSLENRGVKKAASIEAALDAIFEEMATAAEAVIEPELLQAAEEAKP